MELWGFEPQHEMIGEGVALFQRPGAPGATGGAGGAGSSARTEELPPPHQEALPPPPTEEHLIQPGTDQPVQVTFQWQKPRGAGGGTQADPGKRWTYVVRYRETDGIAGPSSAEERANLAERIREELPDLDQLYRGDPGATLVYYVKDQNRDGTPDRSPPMAYGALTAMVSRDSSSSSGTPYDASLRDFLRPDFAREKRDDQEEEELLLEILAMLNSGSLNLDNLPSLIDKLVMKSGKQVTRMAARLARGLAGTMKEMAEMGKKLQRATRGTSTEASAIASRNAGIQGLQLGIDQLKNRRDEYQNALRTVLDLHTSGRSLSDQIHDWSSRRAQRSWGS